MMGVLEPSFTGQPDGCMVRSVIPELRHYVVLPQIYPSIMTGTAKGDEVGLFIPRKPFGQQTYLFSRTHTSD